jgi:hypothetical protein
LDSNFGSTIISSSAKLKTNLFGFLEFWVGDEFEINGGYESTVAFKIVWQNDIDSRQEEIDNVYLFSPVRPIDISDNIKGVPSNKDIDKVISNKQGYKWENHVSSVVPSASPHDLHAVDFFDSDSTKNKVISNKLGYQMYQIASLSSTTSIDISAASFYEETITTWDGPSGGLYYKAISHNLGNKFPIVRMSKVSNDVQVIDPNIIESLNSNDTVIFWDDNISVNVIFFG